jgi:hypothetical protein
MSQIFRDADVRSHDDSERFKPRVGFVNRWELENLREYANPRGIAWTATLCFGGLAVGLVENMGDGGVSWPLFNSSTMEDVWLMDLDAAYSDADQQRFIDFLVASYDGVRVRVDRHSAESVA